MKSAVHALHFPRELEAEIRATDAQTRLSMADVMRQSMIAGLPKVREKFSGRVTNVDPLPEKEARKLYAEREDDMDSSRLFIAAQPKDGRSAVPVGTQ